MNRKITKEENKQLFKFCNRNSVHQYDLQIELVDHLASAIEEQWEKKPELTLNETLKNTFGKFGIYGFSKIKQQKERELRRKYNRLLWKYLVEFYRLPKIIMTLALTLVLFILLQIVENKLWILVPYFTFITIFIIFYFYKIFPKEFNVKTKPGKSFMILEKLKEVQFLVVFVVLIPFQIATFWNISKINWINDSDLGVSTMALLIVTFTIALYGEFMFIPKKIKEHFMEQFGEYAV
ncbi:MAG: hypothetical protein GQ525_15705 [Draconibacterium sp.]|nr:hypothetical protein [Draconibacterium sp.]